MFLLEHGLSLEVLGCDLCLNELLVLGALHLAAGFAELTLGCHLVGQVLLKELLLLLLVLQAALDLVEGFFRAEMWLVVEVLDGLLNLLPGLLLSDLAADEIDVGTVLVVAILRLDCLHAIHVVNGRVELTLLGLSQALDLRNFLVEPVQSLLAHDTHGFVRAVTLVGGMVVHGERALRA